VRRHLRNFEIVREKLVEVEAKDAVRNFQPPITGELIMQRYNIPPSREVGMIKDVIKDAILDGVIHNNYEEAYKLMEEKAAELGLK
jgi:poly(A) polymerase